MAASNWVNQVVWIIVFYLLAWLVSRVAQPIANRIVSFSRFAPRVRRSGPERRATLQGLVARTISFLAFAMATLASLSLFIPANTLIWIIGLFSAAFGLGARPVISESGVIGQQTESTLVTKARSGRVAEMRPRLLALVQERLAEADIVLSD